MKKFLILGLAISLFSFVNAQHQQSHCDSLNSDTTVHNVRQFFSSGTFYGHGRHFFMSTIHPGHINDYYANAIGGASGYNSARVMGFSMGLKGQFSYNVWSNELSEVDENTGAHSRYELQLFDIEDPHNKNDLDRLEELYVDYLREGFYVKYGKMDITTPLVNPQDGRMKPYVLQGLYSRFKLAEKLFLSIGGFDKFSPRSTTHWHSAAESIGIYGNGFSTDGSKAEYRDHLETKGLLLTSLHYHNDHLRIGAWNYYIDNISNTVFGQVNYHHKITMGELRFGLQYLKQNVVGTGGAIDNAIEHKYVTSNDNISIVSTRITWALKQFSFGLNGLKTFGEGRFIFPREWGREQFFTTVSRGRIEGAGNVSVVMLKSRYKPIKHERFTVDFAGGYFSFPDIDNYALNKYAMPSHFQFNADIRYSFSHLLEGMEMRLLYIYKTTSDSKSFTDAELFNKSHYHQFNVITNILF